MFDLTKTLGNDSTKFTNSIVTSNFNYKIINNENKSMKLSGEGGFSDTKYINNPNSNAPKALSDWFYDLSSSTHIKKKKLRFTFGVKDIGKDFRSPGAQTKRINY